MAAEGAFPGVGAKSSHDGMAAEGAFPGVGAKSSHEPDVKALTLEG
jgi:hypothetical protein